MAESSMSNPNDNGVTMVKTSHALEQMLRLVAKGSLEYTPELMVAAADALKVGRDEVDYHRMMNADEGHLVWWTLRKALYGHTNQPPKNPEETIVGMPQEWDMVQEAVKRLTEQPLSLDAYQRGCAHTANYPEANTGSTAAVTYTVLGIAGEAGEIADKWKKVIRGDHGGAGFPPEVRALMIKEIGDVLWYAARMAAELGVPLSEVAQGNLDKLADRKERGVIKGSGDTR